MKRSVRKNWAVGAVVVLLVAGAALMLSCRHKFHAPQGFATLHGSDNIPLDSRVFVRAVNPRGVVYRVRAVRVEERSTIAYWSETVRRKFTDQGYTVLEDKELSDGHQVTVASSVDGNDFALMIGLYKRKKELFIMESAGTRADLDQAKPALLEVMHL